MNSLEFINKQIDVTKKQLAKYPLSKEQSNPNYKHKEADIQYIHNKYYTEQLQTLEQIKCELEAWKVCKEFIVNLGGEYEMSIDNYYNVNEYQTLKKALEVEDE